MSEYPWSQLARVDRRGARLVSALVAWVPRAARHDGGLVLERRPGRGMVASQASRGGVHLGADLGIDRIEVASAAVLGGAALADRLADPTAGVVRIGAGRMRGYVVMPGAVVREIAMAVLGGPDEVSAPRPLTGAEQAMAVVAVGAVADALDASVEIEVADLGGPEVASRVGGEAAVVEFAVSGKLRGTVRVVVPLEAIVGVPSRGLPPSLPPWCDAATLPVAMVVGQARLRRAEVARLRVRDVLVATRVGRRGEVWLAIGRGGCRGSLAPGTGRVTVLSTYSRDPVDETLADDASVDVAVALGDVRMSVRALLELRSGQVVELGKPLGSAVELRVGGRVVGRGELVDVDGELGVRVLSIDQAGAEPAR